MENEKLTVMNVEETPLSEGKTLTELHEEMIKNKNLYNLEKHTQLTFCGVAGACFLAGLAGMAIAGSEIEQFFSVFFGSIAASASIGIGLTNIRFLQYAREDYHISYKKYYDAIKKENMENLTEEKEELRGKSK